MDARGPARAAGNDVEQPVVVQICDRLARSGTRIQHPCKLSPAQAVKHRTDRARSVVIHEDVEHPVGVEIDHGLGRGVAPADDGPQHSRRVAFGGGREMSLAVAHEDPSGPALSRGDVKFPIAGQIDKCDLCVGRESRPVGHVREGSVPVGTDDRVVIGVPAVARIGKSQALHVIGEFQFPRTGGPTDAQQHKHAIHYEGTHGSLFPNQQRTPKDSVPRSASCQPTCIASMTAGGTGVFGSAI